jgi:AraC-like DNA-binding protein
MAAPTTDLIDPNKSEAPLPISSRYYVPQKPLSEFVAVFWYWRGHDVPHSKERILPTGNGGLVINLGSGRTSQSGISGPRSESFLIERTAQDELLGVHFNIGGVFPFLGFPSGELHDVDITLADLWGERRASQLLCLVHDARTVELKFQVVEKWLMMAANRPLRHHPAVSFALKEFQSDPGLLSSAVVAEKVNLSQRRFIQIFREEVGLTPKLFCRIRRFRQVIERTAKQDAVDWADVALSCGYFDQAHFNHDFKEFSGLSPTEYLTLRTRHLRHVQVRG